MRTRLLLSAACLLLSGCTFHGHLHYHAPAATEPAMTLEIPALEQPDDQVD